MDAIIRTIMSELHAIVSRLLCLGLSDFELFVLTPVQRWQAARRFEDNSGATPWFTILMVLGIVVLVVVFLAVTIRSQKRRQETSGRLFTEYSRKRGLSGRERKILQEMGNRLSLRQPEAIFTMASAFERGFAEILEDCQSQFGSEAVARLRSELSFLRQKLGFSSRDTSAANSVDRPFGSRQIPVGEQLYITRRKGHRSDSIGGTVLRNDDKQLAVALNVTIENLAGELWQVRYSFGGSVWEFDTSAISCDGKVLALKHSDAVRFVNRRRFLRVPVDREAFVACFPFMRTIPAGSVDKGATTETKKAKPRKKERISLDAWKPLEFVPAVVTELAGPGLRIEAPLKVSVGDRILVLFRLDKEKEQASEDSQEQNESTVPRIVEDLGIVRHTIAAKNGLSIAVEFVGLNDTEVNELVRETNVASMKSDTEEVLAEKDSAEAQPAALAAKEF